VINTSNSTSKNNPQWRSAELVRPARPPQPRAPDRAADATAPASPARLGRSLGSLGRVLLNWLAAVPRRLGDRLFVTNDTEAYWRDWQIIKTHGGLARRYRDPGFDTLAECPKCHGAGVNADLPCPPCLGTGRITLPEVS
jgi:hypothetical protein